jgi:hypothetical protein
MTVGAVRANGSAAQSSSLISVFRWPVWLCVNEEYLWWQVRKTDTFGFRNGTIALRLGNDTFVAFGDLLPAGITLLSPKQFCHSNEISQMWPPFGLLM